MTERSVAHKKRPVKWGITIYLSFFVQNRSKTS
uniref:Uncharacterized protein n=1 Tax=Salmonella phage PMBT37 TaxID=3153515 RepID=A0AAU8GPB9_9CAUD